MQSKKEEQPQVGLSKERIAQHEAAHGIVWYLFRNNWIVNKLTIQRDNLPEADMNGALHITANFKVESETNIERANELFAIAMAGMIGQNMDLVIQRKYLLAELGIQDFNQIFDKTGCGGDFKIAKTYLPHLGDAFKTKEGTFTQIKVMDLVDMFQSHRKVQQVHSRLSLLLLEKGTLTRAELISFFETENFQEYVEEENLDINFYHQR